MENDAARGDFCCWNAASCTFAGRRTALGTCERNAEKDGALMAARDVFLRAVGVEPPNASPSCCCACACAVAGDAERADAVPLEV